MAHTGAQLSGSGAQLSGSGAQLSAISAYLHKSYLGAQLSASHFGEMAFWGHGTTSLLACYSPNQNLGRWQFGEMGYIPLSLLPATCGIQCTPSLLSRHDYHECLRQGVHDGGRG